MRGLTDDERIALTGPIELTMTQEMADALDARGLTVDGPCVECGHLDCCEECDCACELVEAVVTPSGRLALRLDAAARAIGVPRG